MHNIRRRLTLKTAAVVLGLTFGACSPLFALELTSNLAGIASSVQQPDELSAALAMAVELFNSPRQDEAKAAFDRVVDGLDRVDDPWNLQQRRLLVSALTYRSQLLLNGTDEASAQSDLRRLIQVEPDFRFDDALVSPTIVALLQQVRDSMNAMLLIQSLPIEARVWVDDVRIDGAGTPFPVTVGNHTIRVDRNGYVPEARQSIVVRGQTATVSVSLQPIRTTTSSGGPPSQSQPKESTAQPPAPRTSPLPWHRIYLQGSLAALLYGAKTSVELNEIIYERKATFDVAKAPRAYLGQYDFGGAVRLWKALGIGAAYTATERHIAGVLTGSVPDPRFASSVRTLSATSADTQERERAYHLEIRGQLGDDSTEAAFFIGPSFVKIQGDRISLVTIRELTDGDFVATSSHQAYREHQVGLNLGFDISWFPIPVVGLGGGVRYVVSRNQQASASASESRQSTLMSIGVRIRL